MRRSGGGARRGSRSGRSRRRSAGGSEPWFEALLGSCFDCQTRFLLTTHVHWMYTAQCCATLLRSKCCETNLRLKLCKHGMRSFRNVQ